MRATVPLLLLLAGCGKEQPPADARGRTPQAALDEFNAAVAAGDGGALLECIVPEQREHVPILCARGAALLLTAEERKEDRAALEELDGIVRRRGVSSEGYALFPKPEEFRRIEDRAAFVTEMLRFEAKHRVMERAVRLPLDPLVFPTGAGAAVVGSFEFPPPLLPVAWKLKPRRAFLDTFVENGDFAAAEVVGRIGSVDVDSVACFRRVEGRWYVEIPQGWIQWTESTK